MTANPSRDEETPRPWRQTGTAEKPHWYITSAGDGPLVHGPRMDYADMAPETYARWTADAALIVEAVNAYDRLRAIEAVARAISEWADVRKDGSAHFPVGYLNTLREALEPS